MKEMPSDESRHFNLPMFDEYAFIERYGSELTGDELDVLSQRIDSLGRRLISFNDAAIDMLHHAISDWAFEEGSMVVEANLLNCWRACSATWTGLVKRWQNAARRCRHPSSQLSATHSAARKVS